MFSTQPRCIYRQNQLGEVICQLRFPEILRIQTQLPDAFQEKIRDDYPRYSSRNETPAPKISGIPGHLSLENRPQTVNYQFQSEDGIWRVNLTSCFLSLACGRYTCWEDFAGRLDKPLAAFISLYQPAYFERVGLRYLNFISRQSLGLAGDSFRDLIAPCYLGVLADTDVAERAVSRCGVDMEVALRGGCKVRLHAGPGLVRRDTRQDNELKFVFDQDLFMAGNVPVNYSAGALQTLHGHADSIFRGAITNRLHEAMQPE